MHESPTLLGHDADLPSVEHQVIVHVCEQQYTYKVRTVKEVKPTDIDAMLKHEELP